MSTRKRRRGLRLDRRLLILFSVMPIGCLLAILVGLTISWYLIPTRFVNARVSDLSETYADEIVIMAAADFAQNDDVERAKTILAELKVPNTAQYVSMVAERMIRTNRGPVDQDIKNVVRLADALGVSTVSMIAYVAGQSTPIAPLAPPPTPTPTNTLVVQSVQELQPSAPETAGEEVEALAVELAEAEVAEAEVAEAEVTEAEAAPAEEPTAVPPVEETPVPTETPVPPPTDTPVPPTDTPTPEPAAASVPDVDFIIVKQRLLTRDENGGCAGNHNIFVDVIDAAGNPLKGVQLGDIWNNPGPTTGHKGDDRPGRAEYDLYKNGGYHILVKSDPSAGRDVSSQVTELLSSDDWKIGIPRLIEAGYCPDEGTCRTLWNSGEFGVGTNSLCWGHYSWEVVFQRTW